MNRAPRFAGLFLLALLLSRSDFVAAAGDDKKEEKKPEIKGTTLLIAPAGQKTTITVYGENLDTTTVSAAKSTLRMKLLEAKVNDTSKNELGGKKVVVEVEAPADCKLGEYELTLANADGKTVKVPVTIIQNASSLSVKKPCADFTQAMPITGDFATVTGFVEKNSPQVFRFEAKAGEQIAVTLLTRHLGYGLDAVLCLRDSRHNPLALSAGNPKKNRQISFRAPAAGSFYLELADSEGRGGETFCYRLTLLHMPGSSPISRTLR